MEGSRLSEHCWGVQDACRKCPCEPSLDTEEERVVPEVMKLLVNLPEHDKIRYAATLVLGRYTEWTAKHPEYLEFQLNYISSGFENQSKDVMSAAAQALKHFCQDCKKVYQVINCSNI